MYTFETEVWLPRPHDEVFDFFADASNLESITPPWLRFRILTPLPLTMGPGTLIDYRIRLHGIPIHWQTEITTWEPTFRFVDEQRRGPYRKWVHEHTFLPIDGGTLVSDRVEYAVPGGFAIHRLFVRRDLDRIFSYRQERLTELLGVTQLPAGGSEARESC